MQVSRATLINYEKGHTAINTDVLNRLEKVFPDFINFNKHDSKPKIINENYIDFKVLYEIFIGGSKTDVDLSTVAPHHTPDFYVDDSAISTGIRSMVSLTIDYILEN